MKRNITEALWKFSSEILRSTGGHEAISIGLPDDIYSQLYTEIEKSLMGLRRSSTPYGTEIRMAAPGGYIYIIKLPKG